ncbi:MAG: glycosyltransferase family 39 protein [Actinomycetota bacterium]|nr:glycosyltransferase family 39 protein [Actinomycetota bacterium]
MSTVTAPSPPAPPPPGPPGPIPEIRIPARFQRIPGRLALGVGMAILIGLSLFLRTKYIDGQFWDDEGLSVGIASHSLSAIPGVLRHDGSPPLYYLLLHVWMQVFGSSGIETHAMSDLFSMLAIPVGTWAGWSLWGRRAGLFAAVLFATSSFLTYYGQETRMYSLMALLGIMAAAGFIHAFVYRRRRYLVLFAVAISLMLYTHAWGLFFWAGSAIALMPVWFTTDDRKGLVRDAAIAFIGAGVLFLPWTANFIYQATHTGAPWDSAPRFGAPVQLSRDLLGGDRITAVLVLGAGIGLAALFTRRYRRTPEATAMFTMAVMVVATLALAWVASQVTPAWVSRYFAPILGPMLLLAALGLSRAGVAGALAIVLSVLFLVNPASYIPKYKSDLRDVGGEMATLVHPGDLVISGQPDQIAATWYYLPGGLRWASTIGPVADPRYMNWVDALKHLQHAGPHATFTSLVDSVPVGHQILFVRPLTEGAANWKAPWTQLVRRRSAQWGALFAADTHLQPVAWAPHAYPGATILGDSAELYKKVS